MACRCSAAVGPWFAGHAIIGVLQHVLDDARALIAVTHTSWQGCGLHWVPHRRVLRSRIPASLLYWLLDPTSLTHRVRQACPGRFGEELAHTSPLSLASISRPALSNFSQTFQLA